jgi:hypothetical protein
MIRSCNVLKTGVCKEKVRRLKERLSLAETAGRNMKGPAVPFFVKGLMFKGEGVVDGLCWGEVTL